MIMSFNGVLLEDLSLRVKQLGDLFTIQVKTKDSSIFQMHQEARIYMFLQSYYKLNDLLISIYEGLELSKQEGSDQKNAAGEALTLMIKEKMINKEQAVALVHLYDAAALLTFDRGWLSSGEDEKVFQDLAQRIPRYYYAMNTFVGNFSKHIVLNTRGK
jgi:hypothetical protein